jgi:hypothetical protein
LQKLTCRSLVTEHDHDPHDHDHDHDHDPITRINARVRPVERRLARTRR